MTRPGRRDRNDAIVSAIVPVTVAVTTYNDGELLAEALESVAAQTVKPAEIIVVDDGSEPATAPGVIRRLESAQAMSVEYHRQANAGPSAARNRGLALATQPLIAYLDADDRWRPEHLERKVERMNALPDSHSTVYDACVEFDHATGLWLKTIPVGGYDGSIAGARLGLPGGVPAGMPFQLHRVKALRQVGGFDTSLRVNEDFDLLLRLAKCGYAIAGSAEATLERRVRPDSLTKRDPARTLAESERFLAKAEHQGLMSASAISERRKWARFRAGKALGFVDGGERRGAELMRDAFRFGPPRGLVQWVAFLATRSLWLGTHGLRLARRYWR